MYNGIPSCWCIPVRLEDWLLPLCSCFMSTAQKAEEPDTQGLATCFLGVVSRYRHRGDLSQGRSSSLGSGVLRVCDPGVPPEPAQSPRLMVVTNLLLCWDCPSWWTCKGSA